MDLHSESFTDLRNLLLDSFFRRFCPLKRVWLSQWTSDFLVELTEERLLALDPRIPCSPLAQKLWLRYEKLSKCVNIVLQRELPVAAKEALSIKSLIADELSSFRLEIGFQRLLEAVLE